jgi:hypothetical protein
LIVVSPASRSTAARTDDRGRYRLDLTPGLYMIGVSESGWRLAEAGGNYALMPPAESEFTQIRVVSGTTTVDLGILGGAE